MFFDSIRNIENDVDVLVIDDCSTDDTIELCKEYNHEVIVKETGLGLTDSWNKGYVEFKDRKYDYFILANNDILIPNGAITELKNTFEKWHSVWLFLHQPLLVSVIIGSNP